MKQSETTELNPEGGLPIALGEDSTATRKEGHLETTLVLSDHEQTEPEANADKERGAVADAPKTPQVETDKDPKTPAVSIVSPKKDSIIVEEPLDILGAVAEGSKHSSPSSRRRATSA